MEITKDNYEVMEPIIIQDIENSFCISLDLELTGINQWNNNIIDFPDARYSKYKSTAEKYRIIQLGICVWKREFDSQNSKYYYTGRPYNIYVFPEENIGNNHINCETGALLFNKDHKMDFNKWIYKGIPYLNSKQENSLKETLMEGRLNFYNQTDKTKLKNISLFKDEDKVKYEEFCKGFSEFLYSDNNNFLVEKYPKYFLLYIINNMQENIRKRIYFSYETIEGNTCIMISKVNEEEKRQKIEIELQEMTREINKRKGVKKIFEALVKNKCIFVGHNCNLDLMFIISHFGDQLPNSLKEYKEMLKSYFGSIHDTKYIYEHFVQEFVQYELGKTNSHLETVYSSLKKLFSDKIQVQIHDDMKNTYNQESGVYHEAAFDAFVTGSSFIWMGECYGDNILKLSNKIYLMKSIYPCFNLDGDEYYLFPNAMAYCLKLNKHLNDIDLKILLEKRFYDKIKRFYKLDANNSLLILVHLDSAELMNEFENTMSMFHEMFQFLHFYKFKQLLKEEEDKKAELKKFNHNYI